MAEIAASKVMELRGRTGLGMMECKRALAETGGDMAKAEEQLRIKSGARASKAADRVAAEGVIGLAVATDGKVLLVEVNSETDFVARTNCSGPSPRRSRRLSPATTGRCRGALGGRALASGETVDARRVALVQKIGENLSIRRFARRQAVGRIAAYVHGVRIGVLVDVTGGDPALGKDLAMHVAASKPIAVDKSQVPADVVAHERTIAAARAAGSGKPPNIVEK
jgi:elongation factor Ts